MSLVLVQKCIGEQLQADLVDNWVLSNLWNFCIFLTTINVFINEKPSMCLVSLQNTAFNLIIWSVQSTEPNKAIFSDFKSMKISYTFLILV